MIRRGYPLAVLLTVSIVFRPADSVNYINDELLWTKQPWNQSPEYKLPFPWQHFAKQEPQVARLLESVPWTKTSLSGPLGNIQAEIDRDIKRHKDLQPSRFDVSLLDDSASIAAAAGVAQCKVCMALASALWRGLTDWVGLHEAVPSRKRIAEYAEQLCELEVPNEVLGEWVLLRAKVQPSQLAPFSVEGNQEFYMLSQRQKQHATPSEMEAVRRACKTLLQDDSVAAAKGGLVRVTSGLVHKYFDHLERRLGKASSTGAALEAVDDGPQMDLGCVNRHPQCEMWAEKGECAANPTYMIGDEKQYIGQCNKACGDCRTPVQRRPEWSDAVAEQLAIVRQDLLAVLHSRACVSGPPCAGATGSGMEQLLALAGGGGKGGQGSGGGASGAEAGGTASMKGIGFVSGPVVEKEKPAVDPHRFQISKTAATRDISDTFVAHKPPKKPYSRPPTKLADDVAHALWAQMGNKCMYTPTGWWMYELCYLDSITQFHMAENQQVDWVISLGQFATADWTVRNTTDAALFPRATQVPYISQMYTGGNDCELTEDTTYNAELVEGAEVVDEQAQAAAIPSGKREVSEPDESSLADKRSRSSKERSGSGDSSSSSKAGSSGAGFPVIKRTSELRIMCSPDLETRVYVQEPRQCRYRVELYLPLLCLTEGFKIIMGWAGANDRPLSKFAELFAEQGLISVRSVLPTTHIMSPVAYFRRRWAQALLDVLRELALSPPRPLVFYAFSNGGGYVVEQLQNLIETDTRYSEYRHLVLGYIFDSAPGFMDVNAARLVLTTTMSPGLKRTAALAAHSVLSFFQPIDGARGKEYWDNMLRLGQDKPQLYLYSQDDPLCHADRLTKLLEAKKQRGQRVTSIKWEKSEHVTHFKLHRQEYLAALVPFLQSLQEDSVVRSKL
ncbi:hypothetical protein N2152v2_006459 [Parachlorella kessleri]